MLARPGEAPLDRWDKEGFVRFCLVPVGHRGVVVAALVGVAVLYADPDGLFEGYGVFYMEPVVACLSAPILASP